MTEKEKRAERFVKAAELSLDELYKIAESAIEAVDPEKAKVAVQGKAEALEKIQLIYKLIDQQTEDEDDTESDPKKGEVKNREVIGIEGRVK